MTIEAIITIVMAVAGLVMVFVAGKDHAQHSQAKKEKNAKDKAKKVSDEQDSKSDDAVRSDAAKWVRRNKR